MKSVLTLLVLIALAPGFLTPAVGTNTNQRAFDKCPRIAIASPDDFVDAGVPIKFVAKIDNAGPAGNYSFNWTVSAGTITGGEGTSEITVDSAGLGGQSVKATVEIGGFPAECANSESYAVAVRTGILCWRAFDQYGDIAFDDEEARLDNFAIALQNESEARGYIMVYAARRAALNEVRTSGSRARNHLVKTRGIDAGRIVIIYCGRGEETTKYLHIVPRGVEAPSCSAEKTVP